MFLLELRIEFRANENTRQQKFTSEKGLSPPINKMQHVYTLLASFDHDHIHNFPRTITHLLFFL